MSEQYCRLFEIYEYSTTPKKTFEFTDEADQGATQAPIRLSYHNGNHYNSVFVYVQNFKNYAKVKVRDQYRATIGLGLGIAGLNAGSADDSLIDQVSKVFKPFLRLHYSSFPRQSRPQSMRPSAGCCLTRRN